MKNLFLTSIFIISSLFSIAQEKNNFMTFNFKTMDITKNPNVKLENLTKVGPTGDVNYWDGFNHYEIDLKKKIVIHCYVGEESGQGDKYKIFNLKKTNDYYIFDVKDKESNKMTFLIPLKKESKYKLLVKYITGKNTEVAFFETSSLTTPFN